MSENQTAPSAPVAAVIPDFTISPPQKKSFNGVEFDVCSISFGTPSRVIEMRNLDEGDQWDIAELAGATLSENMPWMSRTMIAFAITGIDGVPYPSLLKTRDGVRNLLRKLGSAGVSVAMQGLASMMRAETAQTDPLDAAKN